MRLVFSPELAIATFGGDLDNYEFPRYVLDVTYLRVSVDGRPLDTSANFLRYAARDVGPGELTFTAGNPAQTSRLDTSAMPRILRTSSGPTMFTSGCSTR